MSAIDDKSEPGLKAMRQQISAMIPPMLAKAAADHHALAFAHAPASSKDFSVWQMACCKSLSHMEQLVKMAEWLCGQNSKSDMEMVSEGDNDERLMEKAKAALSEYPKDIE